MSLLASFAVLISCGDDEDPAPEVPDPATVNAGFTSAVDPEDSYTWTFTNTSVILGIDDLTGTYAWDFGDGSGTSTDASPTYTYADAGEFTVTLTVTAADGTEGSTSAAITVTAPKNKYVSIFDQYGTGNEKPGGGNDNGELRLQLDDSIRVGRLTYRYRLPVEGTEGYPNVAGTSTTSDFSIFELRLKSDPLATHGWREGAGAGDEIAGANFPAPSTDWVDVEVTWVANGTDYVSFTLIMDGQTVVTDAVSATDGGEGDEAGHLEATKDGVKNLQWKYGSSSAIEEDPASRLWVDDIKVYSSDSGAEVLVFEDDFQSYDVGFAWTFDDEPTTYHPNSIDAEVAEEE